MLSLARLEDVLLSLCNSFCFSNDNDLNKSKEQSEVILIKPETVLSKELLYTQNNDSLLWVSVSVKFSFIFSDI
jgi:hypothetical protein